MTRRFLLPAALAAAIAVGAQINSPTSDGYLSRGAGTFSDSNFIGCIDQLSHIDRQALTDDELEQADFLMASSVYRTEGAVAAKPLFERFLTDYPQSMRRAEAMMRMGDCLMESSYPQALAVYDKIDAQSLVGDLSDELNYHTAYCYLRLGEIDKAGHRFAALTADKKFGNASRFYMGYIAYYDGDFNKAVEHFKTVNTATAPGNMADYYLSQIYYKKGDYGRALSTARALLRRNGDIETQYTAEANRIAGEALYRQGNTSEAVAYLNKYTATVESPQPSALYILGHSEYLQGDYTKAVSHLQPVTEGNDAMAQSAYLYIGQAMLKDGNNDAALLAFDKALRMDYDKDVQEAAFYNYAVAKMAGGKVPFGSSAATFEEFLRRYPNSRFAPQVQDYIVTGYLTDNDYDEALSAVNRMSNPSEKVLAAKQRIHYTLGARALATDDVPTALNHLKQAKALNRYDGAVAAETALALGEAQYRTGDYDNSISNLSEYLRGNHGSDHNRAVARYDLGYARFAKKDYAGAEADFLKVVENRILSAAVIADAYNRLGDISYYAKNLSTASERYDKAYATYPSAGDYALFQKAVMKGFQRDHKAKIAGLQKLEEEFPASSLMPDALLELTESHIQIGDNKGAIDIYRRLVSEYPATSQGRQGYLQLALTLLNDGNREQAVDAYKTIIRKYPTSDEALEASEALKRISADDGTLDDYMAFLNSVDNAPKMDVTEADKLTFEAAEKAYINNGDVSRLKNYLRQHSSGAYAAQALGHLLENAIRNGNKAEAQAYAAQLVEKFPDNRIAESAYIVKGDSELSQGRADTALQTYLAAAERASSSAVLNSARAGIMRAAQDLGQDATVIEAADALLSSSTAGSEDKAEAAFARAGALDRQGKTDEARKIWGELAAQTDMMYGAQSAVCLAESYLEAGDTGKAKTAAESLINSGTPHTYWLARAFITLSDIYAAQGKAFEAREYLLSLRENYPGKEPDIFKMIDERLGK